ncbi:response regulator transcription factor [uncultured Abyssibacter sp.]|uniref:response regulator transcription factor n=1 Tax=uncultured Abyssibacter sp. TaxID=2320202 RepID=UPI0032B20910
MTPTAGQPPSVIVADDHPLLRSALCGAVEQVLPGARVIEAGTAGAVQQAVTDHPDADLCTLDLRMPGAYGFSTLAFLRGSYPSLPVLIISAISDPLVMQQAMTLGAVGYVQKSSPPQTIATAIQQVLSGETWFPESVNRPASPAQTALRELADRVASLTPQQFRVLTMLADGLLNKQIAYEMNVTEATIKAHVTAILRKLKVSNRTAAVIAVRQLDVSDPESQLSESAAYGAITPDA